MILWALLPARCREAVAGDLEEIWHGGGVTRWQWWRIAMASVAACWFDQIRAAVARRRRATCREEIASCRRSCKICCMGRA